MNVYVTNTQIACLNKLVKTANTQTSLRLLPKTSAATLAKSKIKEYLPHTDCMYLPIGV